jgi:hypothetical protein
METLKNHLTKYAIYYGIGLFTAILVGVITYIFLKKRVEKFQNSDATLVAGGAAIAPAKLAKETCIQLKSQIDQYKDVKQKYKDTHIENLDETIEALEKYFNEYSCNQHSY